MESNVNSNANVLKNQLHSSPTELFYCQYVQWSNLMTLKINVVLTYHSAHNRSGPTSFKRCVSTLLKATRKYAKKFRICRLTSLVSNVRSVLPKAEYNNFDVIIPLTMNYTILLLSWMSVSLVGELRFNSGFVIVWMSIQSRQISTKIEQSELRSPWGDSKWFILQVENATIMLLEDWMFEVRWSSSRSKI